MTTVILGPPPPEVSALLARRSAAGLDARDECWGGEYYVAPHAPTSHAIVASEIGAELRSRARRRALRSVAEFNLGTGPKAYTVPDGGVLRAPAGGMYEPTAALVVEVLSPEDATFRKFEHYAAHAVDELLVADPLTRTVRCWRLGAAGYVETDTCALLELPMAELAAAIGWPSIEGV